MQDTGLVCLAKGAGSPLSSRCSPSRGFCLGKKEK